MRDYYWSFDVTKRAQSSADMAKLTRGEFVWSGGGMATLEIMPNEILCYDEKICLFIKFYINFQVIDEN